MAQEEEKNCEKDGYACEGADADADFGAVAEVGERCGWGCGC